MEKHYITRDNFEEYVFIDKNEYRYYVVSTGYLQTDRYHLIKCEGGRKNRELELVSFGTAMKFLEKLDCKVLKLKFKFEEYK